MEKDTEKRYGIVKLKDSTERVVTGEYAENLVQLRRILMNDVRHYQYAVYPSEDSYRNMGSPSVYNRKKDPMIGMLRTVMADGKREWVWQTRTRVNFVNKDGTLRKKRK